MFLFFRINQTNLINIRFFSKTSDIYNRDLGSVSKDIESLLSQMSLPDGYYTNLGGTTELMNETFSSLVLVIALGIVLVYMIMASQFESLINPFIIMFTIPLAFSGAWVLLFLTGESMSVMAVIGALVLVGIVVNNGIVLIEYINILRDRDIQCGRCRIKSKPYKIKTYINDSYDDYIRTNAFNIFQRR
jgi:RND superfamily resistance-nodulation-cell division antiporter